jgi:hypothetical protein
MYPALAMLIVRGAIQATELEQQKAQEMILAGPQPGQDYHGSLGKNNV